MGSARRSWPRICADVSVVHSSGISLMQDTPFLIGADVRDLVSAADYATTLPASTRSEGMNNPHSGVVLTNKKLSVRGHRGHRGHSWSPNSCPITALPRCWVGNRPRMRGDFAPHLRLCGCPAARHGYAA